jgi:hypothetical protein
MKRLSPFHPKSESMDPILYASLRLNGLPIDQARKKGGGCTGRGW